MGAWDTQGWSWRHGCLDKLQQAFRYLGEGRPACRERN